MERNYLKIATELGYWKAIEAFNRDLFGSLINERRAVIARRLKMNRSSLNYMTKKLGIELKKGCP
jgi:transcriptional regulator with GAF, ATPase, and Fis domain